MNRNMKRAPRKLTELFGIPLGDKLPDWMNSKQTKKLKSDLILKEEAWPEELKKCYHKHSQVICTPDSNVHSFILDWVPFPNDKKWYSTELVFESTLELVCNYYGLKRQTTKRLGIWPPELLLGENGQQASIYFSNGEVCIKVFCNDISRYAAIWAMLYTPDPRFNHTN